MKRHVCSALLACALVQAEAQQPASSFARGASLQAWQDAGHAALVARCKTPPPPFRLGGGTASDAGTEPPAPPLPAVTPLPGIVAAGSSWRVVWAWQGNNADGPIAGDNGTLLFANNDASNVMQLDPATGLARIVHTDTNTGGALARSRSGQLFVAMRGLHAGVLQLEPERKLFATELDGEPFDCAGGVVNDISAASDGSVYIAVSGSGVFHANPRGVITRQGHDVSAANGIVLSPDERTLYVTNGAVLVAFDVAADGTLANQRDLATLSGGGDGSAVDEQGRLFVAAGGGVDIIAADGRRLGRIPGPPGLHGVAFGGADRRTLFGIVFYGGWGTASARNQIVALPVEVQGLTSRAK